jgi:hypothetical protein
MQTIFTETNRHRLILKRSSILLARGPFPRKMFLHLQPFAMQLLLLIFLVSVQVLTSNAQCIILPITPTDINGLTPCGSGSLTSGCDCCRGGQVACQHLIQECTPGLLGYNYYCTNNPAYVSSCASQDMVNCGNGCMPSGATCCPDQAGWCAAGRSCGTVSNCILDGVSSSSSPSSPEATSPVLSLPTTQSTTTSPASVVTAPTLGSSTTKTTSTSPTTTASALNSATRKATGTTPTSTFTAYSQTPPSIGARKEHGGIRSLVAMAAMNVFIFCWL